MLRIFSIFAVTLAFGFSAAYAEDAPKQPPQKPVEKRHKADGEHSKGKGMNLEEIFKARDVNGDGKLSKEELIKDAPEGWKTVIEKRFAVMDADHDGFVALGELKSAFDKFKERHEKDGKVGKGEKVKKIENVEKVDKVESTEKAKK
jgi:Ca2+-binding EF-hand superfamily protein